MVATITSSPLAYEIKGSRLKVAALTLLSLAFSVGLPVGAFIAAVFRRPDPAYSQLGTELSIGEHFALQTIALPGGWRLYAMALGVVPGTHVFYYLVSTLVQFSFYRARADDPASWKVQPLRTASLNAADRARWWLPIWGAVVDVAPFASKVRVPAHSALASINLFLSSLVAAAVVELSLRSKTFLCLGTGAAALGPLLAGTLYGLAAEQAFQYYWHRVMHTPPFYRRFHKLHHSYKAPEPFDDLMIAPLEGFLYYFMLFSPPLLFRIHLAGFAGYFLIHGLTGIVDHCGVHVRVPLVYSAADHDAHHSRFEVNYATPFPYMDILHGTFRGTWAGIRFEYRGGEPVPEKEQ